MRTDQNQLDLDHSGSRMIQFYNTTEVLTVALYCRIPVVWSTVIVLQYLMYLSVQFVQIFTRSAAVVDGRHGGRFQMLDGIISGEFTHLVKSQLLNQSEPSNFV